MMKVNELLGQSLGVFFPNQGENETGAHINLSAGGIVTHANNVDGAKRFLRFLTNKDSQTHFTNINYEYPVNPNTSWNPLLIEWGNFKRQSIDLTQLGLYHEKAFEIMIKSNWE